MPFLQGTLILLACGAVLHLHNAGHAAYYTAAVYPCPETEVICIAMHHCVSSCATTLRCCTVESIIHIARVTLPGLLAAGQPWTGTVDQSLLTEQGQLPLHVLQAISYSLLESKTQPKVHESRGCSTASLVPAVSWFAKAFSVVTPGDPISKVGLFHLSEL